MNAMPGLSLDRIERMTWPEVGKWWRIARQILEGPEEEEQEGFDDG